nr:transglycosylase SLT domain-containing protein [uncultured Caldimonas sp.]
MAASAALTLARAVALLPCAWAVADTKAVDAPPPAYEAAARSAGVPSNLLYAIALQESGLQHRGRFVPWPWTLNVAGTPMRFERQATACAALRRALRHRPATRVDVGLGQVNVGYHAHRYRDPCELLDPYRNLAIAATILREQYRPNESWLMAAGRYHRPVGGALASRYRNAVQQHLTRLQRASTALASSHSTP